MTDNHLEPFIFSKIPICHLEPLRFLCLTKNWSLRTPQNPSTLRTPHHFTPNISFLCTSHSPNHAYMHEIIHLEPPPTWKKQPAKKIKESTKSYKKAWNQYSFWGNLQRKKPPAKTKVHQSYKNASNHYFLKRNLERKKQLQYNIPP